MYRFIFKFVYISLFIVTLASVVLCYLFVLGKAQGDAEDETAILNPTRREVNFELSSDDDRDVFQDFKTSYLPLKDLKLDAPDDSENIDVKSEKSESLAKRDYSPCEPDEPADVFYPSNSHKELNIVDILGREVNHGPVDDVLEQMRGLPELEEAELPQRVLNDRKSSKCRQTFWKGVGNRETIRKNQAAIMKQFMDTNVDPCLDFYQFACGNWASLNPIPADKTGIDTFEVLRENLNFVLRDLLTSKHSEKPSSRIDNIHLELDDQKMLDASEINKTNNPDEILLEDLNDLTEKKKPINLITSLLEESKLRRKRSSKRIFRKLIGRLRLLADHNSDDSFVAPPNIAQETDQSNEVKKEGDTLFRIDNYYQKINDKGKQQNDPAKGDATLKAKYFYESCMNYEVLQKRGHQPLLDLLDELGGWPMLSSGWNSQNFDWVGLMAELRLYNNEAMISEWVGPDMKNSDEFVIQIDQTTLGLPSRDFYLQDSNIIYLMANKDYLVTIATLLGGERGHVEKAATNLIAFETKLSRITATADTRRNVTELYHRVTLEKLMHAVPDVNWHSYLTHVTGTDVPRDQPIVVFALPYVKSLVALVKQTEPETVANYLLWRFVRHRVNNLDDRFETAKQEFYNVLLGREESPPRWRRCVTQVNQNMGMALGSMFVGKYFDENSKEDTMGMTRDIQSAFKNVLNSVGWLDDETRLLAAKKVDAMMLRIGYPDFIINRSELDEKYENVILHPERYFENTLIILRHLTKVEQARLGQPVNKSIWNTAPAVVNAYYSRNKNQILVPAGILQPPFYHRHFPRSLNYGGIGVVIGHEITHGFDDKGRLFDVSGNLNRWWPDSAVAGFHKRAQCLVDQYGKYVVPEVGIRLDGVNLQGENIADNGGVKQAFHAYKTWLSNHDPSEESLPGVSATPGQLFFLNYAQIWCGATRPESMRNKLRTAVHSPGRFRVIGALSNSEDFAREFNCPLGSAMNPKHKCNVW